MKFLVTGVGGQLGYDVMKELKKRNYFAVGVDSVEMDVTSITAVEDTFNDIKPNVVIHCAAWTAVDAAESNIDECFLVNATGTENVVNACKKAGAKLIYISTDYVFDGNGTVPWKTDDAVNPLNVYGASKYVGEQAVLSYEKSFVVRTAWVFGKNGRNFVKTVLKLARSNNELNFVNDQIGTPTYTADLARLLVDMAETDKYGIYHATNEGGYISWYDFTKQILKECSINDVVVNPVPSSQFKTAAKRPFNSRLDKSKLLANGFKPLPDWQNALKRYLIETGETNAN